MSMIRSRKGIKTEENDKMHGKESSCSVGKKALWQKQSFSNLCNEGN